MGFDRSTLLYSTLGVIFSSIVFGSGYATCNYRNKKTSTTTHTNTENIDNTDN